MTEFYCQECGLYPRLPDAIRRLHWPSPDRDSTCDCYDGLQPCPTIAALDAELAKCGLLPEAADGLSVDEFSGREEEVFGLGGTSTTRHPGQIIGDGYLTEGDLIGAKGADMQVEEFSRNGIDFKLEPSGKWWQLYYRRKSGRWEPLSIWSTRGEAKDAAGMFGPHQEYA